MEKLSSMVSRVFFFGAFALLAGAVVERLVNSFGYTLLRTYSAGRLVDIATVLLMFVVALLLRDIREQGRA